MTSRAASALALLTLAGCAAHPPGVALVTSAPEEVTAPNTLSLQEQRAGWRLLFNGQTTAGWRGYRMDSMPSGWRVENGALSRVGPAGDIVTVDQFRNFELKIDWNVDTNGSSGVFYRAEESAPNIYESAPEMKALDDARQQDGLSPLTASGSDYGLYAGKAGVAHPAGTWNHARVVVRGRQVEQWLNGVKVVEYTLESPDWVDRVAHTRFVAWPAYGRALQGHIGLQDHGSGVQFANIKIRVLP